MVRIHVSYWKLKLRFIWYRTCTKNIVTMIDTMVRWAIDLWWIKIPPTHPCFIFMKNRKERAFEKRKIKLWEKLWIIQLSMWSCQNLKEVYYYTLPPSLSYLQPPWNRYMWTIGHKHLNCTYEVIVMVIHCSSYFHVYLCK